MRLLLAFAALVVALPAAAQEKTPKPSDEIVVEGLLPPGEKPPTLVRPASGAGLLNRKDFEFAQRLAKCAINLPRDRVSAVIDGNIYSPPHRLAQNWVIQRVATCHMSTEIREASMRRSADSSQPGVHATTQQDALSALNSSKYFDQSVTGVSVYDRGAILEQVIERYVPDLALTRGETADPAVQARFNRVEIPRNRFRLQEDYRYFQVAVCLVRLQPELSVRLVQAKPGSKQQAALQSAILNRGRICVGNAKRVYVDSTQFRIYIMDAVYRWVAASRGVTSLILSAAI